MGIFTIILTTLMISLERGFILKLLYALVVYQILLHDSYFIIIFEYLSVLCVFCAFNRVESHYKSSTYMNSYYYIVC